MTGHSLAPSTTEAYASGVVSIHVPPLAAVVPPALPQPGRRRSTTGKAQADRVAWGHKHGAIMRDLKRQKAQTNGG